MSRKYKFKNPEGFYFITFTVVGWVDVFTRDIYRDILINSFKFCTLTKGLVIHAYVIMTNHVHMIISSNKIKPEHIMRDMKKFTSVELIKAIRSNPGESRKEWMLDVFSKAGDKNCNNVNYQFWQQNNHPMELFSEAFFEQKLSYIHKNPVKAGFVRRAEDYPYSSAGDYTGKPGPVKVTLVD